ncbi:hypothetical protein [Kitasatospora sp. NPDC090091]|uniref:hypothetical protein n=1 Tax=Kitasatospora sp. NPDC090091 TaxID=3364081 RepID=UPI0037F3BF43
MRPAPLTPIPGPGPGAGRRRDALVDHLLALADDLEQHAGHGGHWQANMHAAARIRALAAPGHTHRQPTLRDAQVAALTPANTDQHSEAAA